MARLSVVENAAVAEPVAAFRMLIGTPHPPGATVGAGGVNFSLFSANASSVTLRLFARHDDTEPLASFTLDGENHRTFHFWHCFIEGAAPGMFYVFHVDGPASTDQGHRFNASKALIDPYGKGVSKTLWRRQDAVGPGDNLATSLRSAVIDLDPYDWEGDAHPRIPMAETIVYEMHVGGFTRHPTAGVAAPGSFRYGIFSITPAKVPGLSTPDVGEAVKPRTFSS
jgi:glycogen operon protein